MNSALPRGWVARKIGGICRLVNGRAFKPSDWGTTGLPIIRIQNLNDASKPFNYFAGQFDPKHLVSQGDVLLSWSGTPGTSFGCFVWDRDPGVLNQHIFKVHVNTDLCVPEFFVYAVNNALEEMIEGAHGGVGLQHITKSKLVEIELPVAPIEEQHRIAARIRDCLTRIEEVETLRRDAISEALAVRASALAYVFDDLIKQYTDASIESVTVESSYGTNRKCSTAAAGTPILRIPNVQGGSIDLRDLKYTDLTTREKRNVILKTGDLLIVRTNGSPELVGRCAVFTLDGEYGYASYLIRFRLDDKRCLPAFLSYFLASTRGRDAITAIRRTSAGQFNINAENIGGIRFPLPPLQDQLDLIRQMDAISEAVTKVLGEQNDGANGTVHLRDSVLRQAFAGDF